MDTVVVRFVERKWLYAVPLYHFLTSTVKPYGKTPENTAASHQQDQWWGIADFMQTVKRFKVQQKENM